MTPSASASPLIQLGSAAAPATASATAAKTPSTGAENAATAAQGVGFQLLVDAATEQQLAAQVTGNAAAQAPIEPQAGAEDGSTDPGNVLPLAGLILPGASGQPPTAKGDAAPADGDKPKDDTDTDAAAADTVIALPWVPVNIQPAAPKGADSALKTATDDKPKTAPVADPNAAAAAAPVVALAAQAGGLAVGTPAAAAQPQSDDTTQGDVAPLTTVSASNHRGVSIEAPKPSTETATAVVPAADAKTDAGARKGDVASFADLLKPAAGDSQSQSAAQANAPVAMVDGSRAHQATRPYLDIDGNSAATATVSVPVGSSGWSDAVVDKVMWFSANHLSSAEIKLNPPDLGPLQVRISTQHDQASVVFSSPHAAVRDALDQALPKLREMFGGQGLQLSDASVGGQAQRQQQQSGDSGAAAQSRGGAWFGSEDNGDVPVAVTRVSGPRLSNSAVDAYA